MRRPLSLYTGPRCAINVPFINKSLWLYICRTYWTLGFSKESKRCTRLPPYQISLELCLVSLWIKLNEGRMHFVRHNVCCWNLVLYRTYIIIKSNVIQKMQRRLCFRRTDSYNIETIWGIVARPILFFEPKAICYYQIEL